MRQDDQVYLVFIDFWISPLAANEGAHAGRLEPPRCDQPARVPFFFRAAKIGFLLDSNSRLNDPMVIEMCLTGIKRPGEADVAAFVLQG